MRCIHECLHALNRKSVHSCKVNSSTPHQQEWCDAGSPRGSEIICAYLASTWDSLWTSKTHPEAMWAAKTCRKSLVGGPCLAQITKLSRAISLYNILREKNNNEARNGEIWCRIECEITRFSALRLTRLISRHAWEVPYHNHFNITRKMACLQLLIWFGV